MGVRKGGRGGPERNERGREGASERANKQAREYEVNGGGRWGGGMQRRSISEGKKVREGADELGMEVE